MSFDSLLDAIPEGLRKPLMSEYNSIVQNFLEHRWSPSELSGGRFSEIVYTIIEGYGNSIYPPAPSKPRNFVDACRRLESNTSVPRSFQILIPRLLPSLYEIRNNRNVGHVGGDVDPNEMDSTAVVQISGWIMGELIRVFHNVSVEEASKAVKYVTERKIPIIWQSQEGVKRVLKPDLSKPDQTLLLISTSTSRVGTEDVFNWLDYDNRAYFRQILKRLHKQRLIEYDEINATLELLPPGVTKVEIILEENR